MPKDASNEDASLHFFVRLNAKLHFLGRIYVRRAVGSEAGVYNCITGKHFGICSDS
ncbi:hypothetical protein GCM10027018_12930 [Paenibacillus thermoaerophilus]